MTTNKRAVFAVTSKTLEDVLAIPDGHYIYGVEWSFRDNGIDIFVCGPGLPEAEEGASVPRVNPEITETVNDQGLLISRKFKWGD